jgi:hypothetical protein
MTAITWGSGWNGIINISRPLYIVVLRTDSHTLSLCNIFITSSDHIIDELKGNNSPSHPPHKKKQKTNKQKRNS